MSPVLPLGRLKAMMRVARGELPFSFGSPHPTVAVVEQDGLFRLRELVIDDDAARALSAAAFGGHDDWMPEHHFALGRPTGKVYAEASSKLALLARMSTMPWPDDW